MKSTKDVKKTAKPQGATKLETYLTDHGIKRAWLAEKTDIHPQELYRICKNLVLPTRDDAMLIANALGVQIGEVFEKTKQVVIEEHTPKTAAAGMGEKV